MFTVLIVLLLKETTVLCLIIGKTYSTGKIDYGLSFQILLYFVVIHKIILFPSNKNTGMYLLNT